MAATRITIGIILVTSFLFLSMNVSAALVCGNNLSLPGATTILQLSGDTSALGEIPGGTNNYSNKINCLENSGTGIIVGPSESNPVTLLRLDASTMARGEGPTGMYPVLIQMGASDPVGRIQTIVVDASAAANINECNDFDTITPAIDFVEVVRLKDFTNSIMQIPNYTGTPKFKYIICAAYDSSGNAATGDILSARFLNINQTVMQGGVLNANGETNLLVPSTPTTYTPVNSLQGIAICNMSVLTTSPRCNQLASGGTYDQIRVAFEDFANTPPSGTYTGPFLPATVQMTQYGLPIVSNIFTTFTINHQNNIANTASSLHNPSNPRPFNYILDTGAMNLTIGQSYRVILIDWAADYLYNAAKYTENSNQNNRGVLELTVTNSCGNGTFQPLFGEVCDNSATPNGCNPGVLCNATCTQCINPIPVVTGDVFILKDIVFPNVHSGSDIVAVMKIDYNQFLTDPNPTEQISTTIRDSKGVMVLSWGVLGKKLIDLPDFSSGRIQTTQLDIQPAASTPFLNVGDTYTLYATIEPYTNANPAINETELSNNSGSRTFVVLEAPQSYAIPDSPWWMSALTLSIVCGWLFFTTRKSRSI